MEEKTLSVKEVLQITVDLINGIPVPVSLAEQIARPLCQAVQNIEAVLTAIKEPKEGENKDV